MKKKLSVAAIVAGVLMIAAAYAIPWIMLLTKSTVELGIIGGTDWPTAMYLFRENTQWLAWFGGITAAAGALSLVFRKK